MLITQILQEIYMYGTQKTKIQLVIDFRLYH